MNWLDQPTVASRWEMFRSEIVIEEPKSWGDIKTIPEKREPDKSEPRPRKYEGYRRNTV